MSSRAFMSGAWPESTQSMQETSSTRKLCATCAIRSCLGDSISPSSGEISPRIAAKSVDLPQPFGPTRPMRSPGLAMSVAWE